MTLLTIAKNVAEEFRLASVSTVVGNSDKNISQICALADREGKHLVKRYSLQELKREATHTALAQEDQGEIGTIAPGYDRYISETFWNRTDDRIVHGPLSAQDWQLMLATGLNSTEDHFRIRGDRLLMSPNPTAGDSLAFEYFTNRWVRPTSGDDKTEFSNDNDVSLIDEDIIELGVIWRWLKRSGLDYAEEKRDYEVALKNYGMANDARTISLGQKSNVQRGDFKAVAAP